MACGLNASVSVRVCRLFDRSPGQARGSLAASLTVPATNISIGRRADELTNARPAHAVRSGTELNVVERLDPRYNLVLLTGGHPAAPYPTPLEYRVNFPRYTLSSLHHPHAHAPDCSATQLLRYVTITIVMRLLNLFLSVAVVVLSVIVLALFSSLSAPESTDSHTPLHFAPSAAEMSKVAVIGSTGSVGRATVHSLSSHPSVASITAITRRHYFDSPPPTLHEHVVADLFNLQPSDFQGAQTVFCCLGTTRRDAGSAAEFKRQDHDLIVSVARKAAEAGVANFHLVSSYGANANSSMLYTQSKGQTEEEVKTLSFQQLGIWRPSFLDTASYPRQNWRLAEAIALPVFKLLRPLANRSGWRHIAVEQVADAMVKDSLSGRQGVKVFDGSGVILDFLDQGSEQQSASK